jgi:hypothetical protein
MALNQYITRQEVLNGYSAAFYINAFLLKYADKTLVDRTAEWDVPVFGNGATIQVRKYPVAPVTLVDVSTINGALTKVQQTVQQRTVNVTISQFCYSLFEISTINQKLSLNGRAVDDETINAAVMPLVFQVQKHLYDNLILNANILANSPTTTMNTQNSLGNIQVIATSNNMPMDACLMLSNNAVNDLRSHFGTYLNSKVSSPALSNKLDGLGIFSEIAGDNVVKQWVTGTANTSTVTPVLSVAAVDGDTGLTIDFTVANAGLTIIVGDPLTFDSATVFAVARGTYQVIDQTVNQASLIAADAAGVNPDFTPAVLDANGIIITPGFYTVPAGGVVSITVGQTIQTAGNFQTIQAPSAIIPIGTPIKFYADHVASFMVARSGINFASPRIRQIENATNVYSTYEDVNLRYSTQGNLQTETNFKQLASMWGSGYDNFYLIRNMSSN